MVDNTYLQVEEQQQQAEEQQQQEDAALDTVLSPLRQLNLNIPSTPGGKVQGTGAQNSVSQLCKQTGTETPGGEKGPKEEHGVLTPLHRLLMLCGQMVWKGQVP